MARSAPINIGLYRVRTPTVATVSQLVHYQPPTTPSQNCFAAVNRTLLTEKERDVWTTESKYRKIADLPASFHSACCETRQHGWRNRKGTREDKNLKKMEIKGRVALITGAASGIGKAYAIELLNQGAKVAICDINTEEGEKLVETLAAKYGKDRVIFSQCDVTDYPQFEESFQTAIAEFGHIDIVINNAGIMNDRFWELEVDINLNGVIRGTLLAQRFMGTDRGGQGGVVINTGSNTSINPYVSVPIYSATKAAIVSFTRAFGDQYHVDLTGVKVMALCPGATDTKLVRDVNRKLLLARYEDAWQKDIVSSIPQRAEHVAKALVHVLSTSKSGSVWMVEKDQPPHEISFTKH